MKLTDQEIETIKEIFGDCYLDDSYRRAFIFFFTSNNKSLFQYDIVNERFFEKGIVYSKIDFFKRIKMLAFV